MFDYENFYKQTFKDKMKSFIKENITISVLCVPKQSSCLHDIFLNSHIKGTT